MSFAGVRGHEPAKVATARAGTAAPLGSGSDAFQGSTVERRGLPRFLLPVGPQGRTPLGTSDDPLEREADDFSRAVVRGQAAPLARPHGANDPMAEVGPRAGSTGPGNAGAQLPPSVRPRLEQAAGRGLGAVRVHADVSAQRAAHALHARAFTHGEDIWLGRGARADDLALMAHEVAHVAQQTGAGHGGTPGGVALSAVRPCVQRQDLGDSESAGISPSDQPDATHFAFDIVDVEAMTNEALIAESVRIDDWLAAAPPATSEEGEAYRSFGERLAAERELRIHAGHEWLADAMQESPAEIYELVPGMEGLTTIVSIDLETAFSAGRETPAGPVMSTAQYRAYLADRAIPEVDEETFRHMFARPLPLTAFGSPLPEPMAIPYGTEAEGWVARLYYPEAVTLPRAYPAYDLVSGGDHSFDLSVERGSGALRGTTITVVNQSVVGGEWVSVKMIADPASATSAHVESVVSDALRDMANKAGAIRDPHAIDTATFWRMGRASPRRATLHILVPAEAAAEVPALQLAAEARLAATDYGVGGLPPEVEVRVTAWNPRPPGSAAAGPPLPARPALGPGASVGLGAGTGGVIAIAVAGGWMLFDAAEHPDWAEELAAQGGTGVLAGGAQVTIEQAVLSGGARFAPGLGESALRVAGRGLGAGIVSSGLEIYSMSNETRPIGTAEAIVRPARAAAIGWSSTEIGLAAGAATVVPATGAVAVIMASAGYGAAAGSVAPGVGTAIGFIVGIGVGIGAYYLLDEITPGGREDWEAEAAE